MNRRTATWIVLSLVPLAAGAEQPSEVKALSGMSVLGNNEAPKSLVIVPWKSSELGDGLGVSNVLDDRAQPVDKEVFLRELGYYRIRTGAASEQSDSLAEQAQANRQWAASQ